MTFSVFFLLLFLPLFSFGSNWANLGVSLENDCQALLSFPFDFFILLSPVFCSRGVWDRGVPGRPGFPFFRSDFTVFSSFSPPSLAAGWIWDLWVPSSFQSHHIVKKEKKISSPGWIWDHRVPGSFQSHHREKRLTVSRVFSAPLNLHPCPLAEPPFPSPQG